MPADPILALILLPVAAQAQAFAFAGWLACMVCAADTMQRPD